MTWPTAANKTHLDAATDDPKQARGELATLVDKFNEMRTHVSSFMQTFLSRTTASAARSDLDAQQAINSLTTETAPATGDLIGLRDVSAGADRKMTMANMLKVINALTEETTVDGAADFVALYDASASAIRKVKPENLAGAGVDVQTFTASGTWTKPAGVEWVRVELIGGGGAGAAHSDAGGGGGGGSYGVREFAASALGATETVTIGAGATIEAGNGGDTTFGAHLTGYGGEGGADVAEGRGGAAGLALNGFDFGNSGVGGGGSSSARHGGDHIYGGGGGGGSDAGSGGDGGDAFHGGGGGGGGSDTSSAGDGGQSVNAGDGGAGASGSTNAGNGTAPGGGGGGSKNGTPGNGADGWARITSW